MDAAVIPNNVRGKNHGEFRRSIEGTAARTQSLGSGYPDRGPVSWAEYYRSESPETEANALGSGAAENFTRTEGAMGKDKACSVNARAHDEPSSTQQDCRGAACSLG